MFMYIYLCLMGFTASGPLGPSEILGPAGGGRQAAAQVGRDAVLGLEKLGSQLRQRLAVDVARCDRPCAEEVRSDGRHQQQERREEHQRLQFLHERL